MKVTVVSGFVSIPNHPRSAEEYFSLGQQCFPKLQHHGHKVQEWINCHSVEKTWLYKMIQKRGKTEHAVADNPAKNTLAYHCVQHQKFHWLSEAAQKTDADTLVWIDYGILHVPGVTVEIINQFLQRVKKHDFAAPGCWSKEEMHHRFNDQNPNWRFCGGLIVIPTTYADELYTMAQIEVDVRLAHNKPITWEVNTLAAIEDHIPELRWYRADHNETMFTHYH